ncbi:MAG: hypothetical protein IT173_16305 [Acidobacteria bacterium]|nr:hypothetical protein [Acidobacteriota bacterium]
MILSTAIMSDETHEHCLPGVGRLSYFLVRVVMLLVTVFSVIYFGPESGIFRFVSLGTMIGAVVLDVMRLRNIGLSQWWVFVRYLPFGNLLLSIGLQSAQAGWAEDKRLDRAGWAILGVHAALIVFILFIVFRGPGQMLDLVMSSAW